MRTAAAFVALAALGCSGAPKTDPAAAANAVAASIRAMYEAFKARNLDAVAPHMTEGSTCYDAGTSKLLVGRKAVLDHFGAILAMHPAGEVWTASLENTRIDVEGDLAVATYQVSTKEEGAHLLAAVTHVFRRGGDGRWRAVHLHRSWNAPPGK